MPSFADPLIKMVVICCLGLAPLAAMTSPWPYSSGSTGMSNQEIRSIAAFINAHPGYKRACKQLAFERSRITKNSCDAAEHKAQKKLFSLLNNNKIDKQSAYAYWTTCIRTNSLGNNAINYPGTLDCIRFTLARCKPHSSNAGDQECVNAIYDRAYEK